MNKITRNNLNYLTYVSDILGVIFSFFVAYFLRNFGPFRIFLEEVQPIYVYLYAIPFAAFLLVIIFKFSGLYDEVKKARPFTEFFICTKSIFLWALFIMAGSYIYKYDYSRIIVLLTFFFSLIFINLGRALVRYLKKIYLKKGIGITRILIIGAGRPARELARRLISYSSIGYELVGFIDDKALNRKNFPIIGKTSDIPKIIKEKIIDEVYIADPTLSHQQILQIMALPINKEVRFRVVSSLFGLVSGTVDASRIENIPAIELWKSSGMLWPGLAKRIFDIFFALGLYIFTSPIWLIISLAIIIFDEPPALIKQKRVGLMGRQFSMLKFRTMKKGTPKYADSPRTFKDSRVTPIGKFLRTTSLDELPQLLNVIKGDMSMVGPRPEMPQKVAGYMNWQKKRLEVKPGLTGLWQILGRKDLPLEENLEYDFYYINNQSFLLDMVIILKTIPLVLTGKGAY